LLQAVKTQEFYMSEQKFIEIIAPLKIEFSVFTSLELDWTLANVIILNFKESKIIIDFIVDSFKNMKCVKTAEIFVQYL
jgi:hypothetical protein